MMNKSALLAAAALSLMGTVSANAADLNGGSIKDGPVAYAQPAIASAARMYLRGDFSFANQDLGSIYEPPAYTLSSPTIGRTHGFGAGAGMYYGSNVRLDFTYDWRSNADVTGDIIDGAATVQGKRRFGVKSDVALFNVYYDFDAHARFKPYLGVGLGFARNRTANGTIDIVYPAGNPCDPAALPAPTATCSASFEGKTEWSAAGALMAGFSAKLHDRMHLDAGYRFMYMGDAHTGDVVITRTAVGGGPAPAGPAGSPDPKIFDLTAHEFRVGVRWDIK
jgi:opacity protein-like surface antigen